MLRRALIFLLAAALAPAAPAAAGETTAVQADASRDGAVDEAIGPPLEGAWVRDLGDQASMTALVAGGLVFAVRGASASDVRVHALDAATGETRWTAPAADWLTKIAYDAGTLFVYDGGTLRALDGATGAARWSTTFEGGTDYVSAPAAAGGSVYVHRDRADGTGDLIALRAGDGAVRWTRGGIPWAGETAPTVGPDGVYVAYVGGQTYGFDPAGGAQRWWSQGDGYGGGLGIAASAGGRLYRFDWAQEGAALDPATGARLFSFFAARPPSVWGDVLVSAHLFGIAGHDAATGARRWLVEPKGGAGDAERVTPALIVNGIAYVGTEAGRLLGIDTADGRVVSDVRTEAGPLLWIAAGGGRIVVSGATKLQAFAATAAQPRTPSPPPPPGSSAAAPAPHPAGMPGPQPAAPAPVPAARPRPAIRVRRVIARRTLRRHGLRAIVENPGGTRLTLTVRAGRLPCGFKPRRTRGGRVLLRLPGRCVRARRLVLRVHDGTRGATAAVRVR